MISSLWRYYFDTLQVDNALRSWIYQWEWPHKNSEDNNRDRAFWDHNSWNISQQKQIGVQKAQYKFYKISTKTPGTPQWFTQLKRSMNKCSAYKKPQFLCKIFILYEMSCFDLKASWRGCFKGVSSLSDLLFAWNLDDLLDDNTSLVGFCLG